MFSTSNLDFTTLQVFDSHQDIVQPIQSAEGDGSPKFTDLLRTRVDASLDTAIPHGEYLPEGGSDLPQLLTLPSNLSGTPQLLPTEEFLSSAADGEGILNFAASWSSVPAASVESDAVTMIRQATSQAFAASNTQHPASLSSAGHAAAPLLANQLLTGGRYPVPQAMPEAIAGSNSDRAADVAATSLALVLQRDSVRQAPVVESTATMIEESIDALSPQRLSLQLTGTASALPVEALPDRLNMLSAQTSPSSQLVAPGLHGQVPAQASNEQTSVQMAGQTSLSINTPVNDPDWGERISEKVLFLAGNKTQSAEVRLIPAELGPVRVSVAVDDGVANVKFHAQNAAAREAIEQAMPRLREFLAENGLTLGQSSVGGDGVKEGNPDPNNSNQSESQNHNEVAAEQHNEPAAERQKIVTSNALVDTFA